MWTWKQGSGLKEPRQDYLSFLIIGGVLRNLHFPYLVRNWSNIFLLHPFAILFPSPWPLHKNVRRSKNLHPWAFSELVWNSARLRVALDRSSRLGIFISHILIIIHIVLVYCKKMKQIMTRRPQKAANTSDLINAELNIVDAICCSDVLVGMSCFHRPTGQLAHLVGEVNSCRIAI